MGLLLGSLSVGGRICGGGGYNWGGRICWGLITGGTYMLGAYN